MTTPDLRQTYETQGRAWMRGALGADDIAALHKVWPETAGPGARHHRATPLGRAVTGLGLMARMQALWPGMRPVRIVSFDKGAGANWSVPWHQDRTIAVDRRADLPGFTNWSDKQGQWHCEPPEDLLRHMIFMRIHLDPGTAENGAMQIAVGSHRAGLVPAARAESTAETYPLEITTAAPGDVLLLNMLTLHRSSRAEVTSPRRAIRVDFCARDLPPPLGWGF